MKIVNNITYCDEFSNEFTKLYNDTYQILSGYDTIDACAAAIIDFTKHVQLGKMDSFWVNFVSIHQNMEYKNTLPEMFENKKSYEYFMTLYYEFRWLELLRKQGAIIFMDGEPMDKKEFFSFSFRSWGFGTRGNLQI